MSKFNDAFDNLRVAWNGFTMAVGQKLIGDRLTTSEKQLDQQRRAAIVGRDAYQRERDDYKAKWQACGKMNDELLDERDKATEQLALSDCALKALNESATEDFTKLERRYNLLRKRYNTLRDRTISKTPKRKAKAKTKR